MSECPAPSCSARKPSHLFACRSCWFDLPKRIRDQIWDAYRREGPFSEEYDAARRAADDHWRSR